MATSIHDKSSPARQPNSMFEEADQNCREVGASMLWTVFIESDGQAVQAGTAYELDSGQIILPEIAANGRVLLKHNAGGG